MTTAVMPNGVSYSIPSADVNFFKELAARMNWKLMETPEIFSTRGRLELERAMALMDTMMVNDDTLVPADEDSNAALARIKYGV